MGLPWHVCVGLRGRHCRSRDLGLPEQREYTTNVITGILVLGGLYSFVQLLLEPRRIFNRKILPRLAKALRPFHPTKEELASYLERFKRASFKIGKKVKPEVLWDAIQNVDRESSGAFQAP
ncbi:hypothetical protein [Luteolibacter soli]|uniref:Uncharacterized protein n=1 Tax=Luteolibacter soli TaxID=3135280 RepID=A0ABU9ASN5_9BACT